MAAAVALAAVTAAWVWRSTEDALDRRPVERIDDRGTATGGEDGAPALDETLHVLVVGSDSREGLTDEERRELRTGAFDGERTDTVLLFQLRDDGVSVVSFPRDLRVAVPGHGTDRINAALELGGPNAVVGTVEDLVGVELDHYVEVTIPSFLEIVAAAGGVELCLDEPLRDRDSGADFDAGCHDMDGPEALAYVRSRFGARADFDRAERQQRFLAALADRATSLGVLANPVRLHELATTVARGLTVDDGLSVGRMVELAQALRDVLDGGLDAWTLPAYAETRGGVDYMVPYEPGVAALGRRLAERRPLPARPDEDVRDRTHVALLDGGDPAGTGQVESVLFYAGWTPEVAGPAPDGLDRGGTGPVTVHPAGGGRSSAEAVAGALGAPVAAPLADGTVEGDVVVVVGGDAAG